MLCSWIPPHPSVINSSIEISSSCRLPSSGLFTFYTVRFTVCFMWLCTRKLRSPGGTNAQIHGPGSPGKPFAPWARHLRLGSLMVSLVRQMLSRPKQRPGSRMLAQLMATQVLSSFFFTYYQLVYF
jgi:hypothetical protein